MSFDYWLFNQFKTLHWQVSTSFSCFLVMHPIPGAQSVGCLASVESVCKQVNQYDLRRVLQLLSSSPDHRIQEYAIRCVINLAAYRMLGQFTTFVNMLEATLRKQLVQEDAKTILAPFLKSSNSTIRTHAEHAQRNLSVWSKRGIVSNVLAPCKLVTISGNVSSWAWLHSSTSYEGLTRRLRAASSFLSTGTMSNSISLKS